MASTVSATSRSFAISGTRSEHHWAHCTVRMPTSIIECTRAFAPTQTMVQQGSIQRRRDCAPYEFRPIATAKFVINQRRDVVRTKASGIEADYYVGLHFRPPVL